MTPRVLRADLRRLFGVDVDEVIDRCPELAHADPDRLRSVLIFLADRSEALVELAAGTEQKP